MTYLKHGTECLDDQEMTIYRTVATLNRDHRTTNTSQVATGSGYSRATVNAVLTYLKTRGFITDVGKGNAYHWRTTDKTPETDSQ